MEVETDREKKIKKINRNLADLYYARCSLQKLGEDYAGENIHLLEGVGIHLQEMIDELHDELKHVD